MIKIINKANAICAFAIFMLLSCFCPLACYGADILSLPQNLSSKVNDYSLTYDGLRGPVKSVSLFSGKIERDFGKEIIVKDFMTDSIIYSPSKLRKEWIHWGNHEYGTYTSYYGVNNIDCIMLYETINISSNPNKKNGLIEKTDIIYIGNDSIVERNVRDDVVSQTEYKLLPNGYRFVYYPNKEAKARLFSFQNNGTKGYIQALTGDHSEVDIDSKGRVIKIVPQKMFDRAITYEYEYDQFGNIITIVKKEHYRRRTRNGYDYYPHMKYVTTAEYEYDSNGNWIKACINLPHTPSSRCETLYYFRDIEYYTDEEIATWNNTDYAKAREELLSRIKESAESYCKTFAQKMNEKYREALADFRRDYNTWMSPPYMAESLSSFEVKDDLYSFVFSDGSRFDDVRFVYKSYPVVHGKHTVNEDAYFISDDMKIILVPRYDITLGPQWFVGKYTPDLEFKFIPDISVDWFDIYVDKFGYRDDVPDEELNELWSSCLFNQFDKQYEISPVNKYIKRVRASFHNFVDFNEYLINKLNNPYENGFVSPSISSKNIEMKLLEDLNNRKDKELRQNIIDFAHEACHRLKTVSEKKLRFPKGAATIANFDDMGKRTQSDFIIPDGLKIEKLRGFVINGDKYSFTKKDKTVIPDKTFINSMLSDDKSVAIVIVRDSYNYDDVYIVEFDGKTLKSVNYIPRKELKGFVSPDGRTLYY